MRIDTVKIICISLTLSTLFYLSGCFSISAYERLRFQPLATDMNVSVLTQISASALEQMGYKVRTIHDTGYVLGDRPISRFIGSYEITVWIESGTEGRKHLKVKCKSRGCFDCREQEEVKFFLDTFDKLAEVHGLASVASRQHSVETRVLRASQTASLSPSRSSETKAAPKMIAFHKINVTPPKVPAGSAFDLRIEYTVIDTTVEEGQIPVKLSYRISDGKKVFLSKPVEVKCMNGKRMTRVLNLTAAKKKGSYSIEGLLNYNNEVWKRSIQLNVE